MNKKTYYPRFNSYYIEIILIIIGFLLFFGFLFSTFALDNRDLAGVFWGLCLSSWFIPAVLFLFKLGEGYTILDDGIIYRCSFRKHKMLYEDMKIIIFSNEWRDKKIENTPYVTVIGGKMDKVFQISVDKTHSQGFTSYDLSYKLREDIKNYPSRYFREFIKEGSYIASRYSFVWNEREMHKIFGGFSGDYYIAATLPEKFRNKFNSIAEKYNISKEKIFVIDD